VLKSRANLRAPESVSKYARSLLAPQNGLGFRTSYGPIVGNTASRYLSRKPCGRHEARHGRDAHANHQLQTLLAIDVREPSLRIEKPGGRSLHGLTGDSPPKESLLGSYGRELRQLPNFLRSSSCKLQRLDWTGSRNSGRPFNHPTWIYLSDKIFAATIIHSSKVSVPIHPFPNGEAPTGSEADLELPLLEMSAFSRGLTARLRLPASRAPGASLTPVSCTRSNDWRGLHQAHQFQTISCSRASARLSKQPRPRASEPSAARPAARPAATPVVTAAARPAATTGMSYAAQLAAKGTPTILYESPSPRLFTISSLGAGTFCVCYSTWQYWSIFLQPPEGLAWWVPHAYGIILITVVAMGGFFLVGATGIIRTITAVPRKAIAALPAQARGGGSARSPGIAAGIQAAPLAKAAPVQIELSIQRLVPFLAYKRVIADPADFTLPFRMTTFFGSHSGTQPVATGRKLLEEQQAQRDQRRKDYLYDKDHFLTQPFRHGGRELRTVWSGIRRASTREGWAYVNLKGARRQYKLDVSGGWALDHGRALDRLVNVKDRRSLDEHNTQATAAIRK
jgi:hypothetical protein